MFFSQEILNRKRGGYAIVWMSANFSKASLVKKLSKREILAQNLSKLCEGITMPEEPLALRLSASLMLGVTRIYGQQWQILQSDVQEAQQRIKKAFVELYHVRDSTGAAANLEMANPTATRAAITRETPTPDQQGFWLDLDEYTFGPVYTAVEDPRLQDEGVFIPGLPSIQEEDELDDEDDAAQDEPHAKRRKTIAKGGDGSDRPKPKNVVTDDRLINLNEHDFDEPLANDARGSARGIDLGVGDFDLGFDVDFGDFGAGGAADSSINQDNRPREDSHEFAPDFGGEGYGIEPDYNVHAGANAEPDFEQQPQPEQKQGRKRPATASQDDDEELNQPQPEPSKKKKKTTSRAKKGGPSQVDEVILMQENPIRQEDRRNAALKIQEDIDRVSSAERSKAESALAERMIFGAPQELAVCPELAEFWNTHVHLKGDDKQGQKGSKASGPKKRKRDAQPLTPPPETEQDRGAPQADDWNFQPDYDGAGSFGSGEQGGHDGYGFEADYGERRVSDPGSEVGRGDNQGGRLSDLMPWDAFAAERESGLQGARQTSHDGSHRSFSFSRAGTPAGDFDRGRRSSASIRGSDVGAPVDGGEMQMDEADFGEVGSGFKEADMARIGLSKQAANFYDYSKRQAVAGEFLFSDVVPVTTSSATVAAAAFYHVLTLASKTLFRVMEQEAPYGEIRLGLAHVDD